MQLTSRSKGSWEIRIPNGRDATGKRLFLNRTVRGTKKDAERVALELQREMELSGTKFAALDVQMAELFNDLLADYRNNGKDVPWAERKIRLYLGPEFGHRKARQISTSDIESYKSKRIAASAQNGTINRELAVLKRAFRLGKQQSPPKVNDVPTIKMLKENNIRQGFFEHSEFQALRAALPEFLRPVVTFAYHTGCRRAEILDLKWSQVDLTMNVVRLEVGTTKNGEGRLVIPYGEMREMLLMLADRRRLEHSDCPLVFHRDGAPIGDFRKTWTNACKAAGLWDAEKKRPTKLFHDFRRTGVRDLVRAGVSQHVAMQISGHKTDAVFRRYDIVNEADLRQAAAKAETFHAQRKKAQQETLHTKCTQSGSEAVQ